MRARRREEGVQSSRSASLGSSGTTGATGGHDRACGQRGRGVTDRGGHTGSFRPLPGGSGPPPAPPGPSRPRRHLQPLQHRRRRRRHFPALSRRPSPIGRRRAAAPADWPTAPGGPRPPDGWHGACAVPALSPPLQGCHWPAPLSTRPRPIGTLPALPPRRRAARNTPLVAGRAPAPPLFAHRPIGVGGAAAHARRGPAPGSARPAPGPPPPPRRVPAAGTGEAGSGTWARDVTGGRGRLLGNRGAGGRGRGEPVVTPLPRGAVRSVVPV